jgi:hypothetical protein
MRKRKETSPAAALVAALLALGAACHLDALLGPPSGSGGGGSGGGGGGGGGLGARWQFESLVQLRGDSSTMISTGGTEPEPIVVIRAVVHDTAASPLRLEVEVQPVGTDFVNQATAVSQTTPSGTPTYARVSSLADNTGYHWQARVVDDTATSAWLPYGGNAETAPDLHVAFPVATNHLEFTQPPTTTTAGATMAPVKVTLKDGQGNTITSFGGTVSVKLVNANGAALGGNPNDVPAGSGVATFSGLSITQAGSGYRLEATSDGMTGVTSASFAINPDTPDHLVFIVQPINTARNQPITPAVQVAARDRYSNLATSFTGTVYMLMGNDGSPLKNANLTGTVRAAAAGVATFEDLRIDQVGLKYTLDASTLRMADGISAQFDITP